MEMGRILITAFVASRDLMCRASDYFKMGPAAPFSHPHGRDDLPAPPLSRQHAYQGVKA